MLEMKASICCAVWILIVYSNCYALDGSRGQLRIANVLIRHGDRAPLLLLNKASEEFWPDGPGQLTNLGKVQAYELGKYFRLQYGDFLGESYNQSQFTAWSTNVDRTIMSAYCYLAGLFPPKGSQMWNKDLLWQPIPVRLTLEKPSTSSDALSSRCKKYLDKFRGQVHSVKADVKIPDLLQALSLETANLTGKLLSKISNYVDAIYVMKKNNLPLPHWVTPFISQRVEEIRQLGFKFLASVPPSQNKFGGPLIWRIICNMQAHINKSDTNAKMHLYSGHDVTVNGILSYLGVVDNYTPLYASSVMIELSEINNSYFVEVFFRNGTESSPSNYKLPGCNKPCPFETFVSLYQLDGLSCQDPIPQECSF